MDDKISLNIPPMANPFDNFRLGDIIGKGSYGVVTRAVQLDTMENVAIKTVQCLSPENVELALEEFRSLSILPNHPNVVRLILGISDLNDKRTVIQHGDKMCREYLNLVSMALKGDKVMFNKRPELSLVMEYCDGGDLNNYILSQPPNDALNASVLEQLATAITFLHAHQVMHRDLKPENILIKLNRSCQENEPQLPTIKIGDFGLAKVLSSTDQASNQGLYSACGSDFFMAPEVFQQKYHLKADVFSLGIIFWSVVDRITFKDSVTNKILLGTYVQNEGKILPMGEALNDDPLIAISQLLVATSVEKKIIYKSEEAANMFTMQQRNEHDGSTCFQGDCSALRELINKMVNANPDERPTAKEVGEHLHNCITSGQGVLGRTQSASTANRSRRTAAVRAPPLDSPKPVDIRKRKRRQRTHNKDEVSTPVQTPTKQYNYRDSKDLIIYTSPMPPVVDMPQTPGRLEFIPNYLKSRNTQSSTPRPLRCDDIGESVLGVNYKDPVSSAAEESAPQETPKHVRYHKNPESVNSDTSCGRCRTDLCGTTDTYAADGTSTTHEPLALIVEPVEEKSEPTDAPPSTPPPPPSPPPPAVDSETEEAHKKTQRPQGKGRTTKPTAKKRRMSTRKNKERTKSEAASASCDVNDSTEQPVAGNKRKGPAPPIRASKRLRLQSESSACESVVDKEETLKFLPLDQEPLPDETTPPASSDTTSLQPTSSQSQVIQQALKGLWRPQFETSSTSSRTRCHFPAAENASYFDPPQSDAAPVASSLTATKSTVTTTVMTSPPAVSQQMKAHQSSSVTAHPYQLHLHPIVSSEAGTSSASVSSDVASTSRAVQQPNIAPNDYLRSMEIVQNVDKDVEDVQKIEEVITCAAVTTFSSMCRSTVESGTKYVKSGIPDPKRLPGFTSFSNASDPRLYTANAKRKMRERMFNDIHKYTYTKCGSSPSTTSSVSSYQLAGDETNPTIAANSPRVSLPPMTEDPPKPQPELIKYYKAMMEQKLKADAAAAQASCSDKYKNLLFHQAAEAATQNHQLFLRQHPMYQQNPLIMVRGIDSQIANNLQQSAINFDSFLRAEYQKRLTAATSVNNNLSSIYGPSAAFYSHLRSNVHPSVALQSTSITVGNHARGGWTPSRSLPGAGANNLQFSPAASPNPSESINALASDLFGRRRNFEASNSPAALFNGGPVPFNSAHQPFPVGMAAGHPSPLSSQGGRP